MNDLRAVVDRIKALEVTNPPDTNPEHWVVDFLGGLLVMMGHPDYAFVPKEVQEYLELGVAVAPRAARSAAVHIAMHEIAIRFEE